MATSNDKDREHRSTDSEGNVRYFRASSRILRLNDQWYFSTREGEEGPFASEEDAQRELDAYVRMQSAELPPAETPQPEKLEIDQPSDPQSDQPSVDKKVWDQYDQLN